jgi:hypothetical protein
MNLFLTAKHRPRLFLRFLIVVLIPIQLVTSNQLVYAETTTQIQNLTQSKTNSRPHLKAKVVSPAPVTAAMNTPPARLSEIASKICALHLFAEPLIPTDSKTNPVEDLALLAALKTFASNPTRAGLADLEQFTALYPHSVWSGSVYANLGFFYRQNGYYSRAVAAWDSAWALTKQSGNPYIRNLADRVVGEQLTLLGSLGRLERTEPLLREIQGRPVSGAAKELIRAAHESHWLMRNQPGVSFKCGPYALKSIYQQEFPKYPSPPVLDEVQSTTKGFSLDAVATLAQRCGFHFVAVKASSNQPVPTPAVVHWKSGHYAALLKKVPTGYLVKDPTFGPYPTVLTDDALVDEADGFLIPQASATGWTLLSSDQQKTIFGRGQTQTGNKAASKSDDKKCDCPTDVDGGDTPSPAAATAAATAMPTYNIFASILSLTLTDTPIAYTPPIGPTVPFTINLTQYEASQPANFTYFNQGPLVTQNWTAYASGTYGNTITLNVPGGGQEIYTSPTTLSGDPTYQGYYGPELESQAYL